MKIVSTGLPVHPAGNAPGWPFSNPRIVARFWRVSVCEWPGSARRRQRSSFQRKFSIIDHTGSMARKSAESGAPIVRDAWMGVLIFCAALIAYLPAPKGDLLWDDNAHVTRPA